MISTLQASTTWEMVGLEALNVIQVVALAWIASEQVAARMERHRRRKAEAERAEK